MQNASLNVGQPVGDGSALKGKAVKGQSLGDTLLGGNDTDDAFKSVLLAGLTKTRSTAKLTASDTLTAASTAKKSTTATDPSTLLSQTVLSPEMLKTLKNLTPDDLKNLPPQLANVFAAHMGADGKLDADTQNLLDTLSGVLQGGTAKIADLVKAINDPKQSAFLGSLATALYSLQNPAATAAAAPATTSTSVPGDTGIADKFSQLFGNAITSALGTNANVTGAAIDAKGDGLTLSTDKGTVTINVADMTLDQFKAFKKLAFADMAPFLTQPRTVRVDPHTLMKSVQGPSFLDDENAPKVTFIHTANVAGAIPSGAVKGTLNAPSPEVLAQMKAQLQAQGQAQAVATQSATPFFLDAATVAKGTAAITTTTTTTDTTTTTGDQTLVLPQTTVAQASQTVTAAQNQVFNRANFFAALLGVPSESGAPVINSQGVIPQGSHGAQALMGAQQAVQMATAQSATPTTAMAQQIAAAMNQASPRSNGVSVLKGLDTNLLKADASTDDLAAAGIDSAFPVRADVTTPAASASTLLAAKTATADHPATFMVSIAMQRNADNAVAGADRQFTIQLDPENLGKVKVTLSFGEDNSVKAKLVAERPETVALLKKDAGALEKSLHNSGFDVKSDSLSFNLGDNGSFSGNMSQNGNSYQNPQNQGSGESGTDVATIETVMPIFVDPATGMTHVNIVV